MLATHIHNSLLYGSPVPQFSALVCPLQFLYPVTMFRHPGTAILLLVCFLTACSTDYGWKTEDLDTPWIAPGTQATQHVHSYEVFMAAGRTSKEYWGTVNRHGLSLDTIRRQFESYIQKPGWLHSWPLTGSTINNTTQRLAPYRFSIVAIHPSVLVATPLDLSAVTNQYDVNRLIDRPPLQQIESEYIITPLEFGTTVPAAHQFTFINLTSGERQDIQASKQSEGFLYSTQGCRLLLHPTNGLWRVTRLAVP